MVPTRWKAGGLVVLATALTACVVAVEPIVPESDATFDPRLIGGWEEVSGPGRAVVSRAAGTSYTIEYRNGDGQVGRFEARLGRVAERLVLDVRPDPLQTERLAPYADVLIPGHLFLVLDVGDDRVAVATLDPDVLLASIQAGDLRLDHSVSRDRVILRGTTTELRSALGAHFARSGALDEPEFWQRAVEARHPAPGPPAEAPCLEASPWPEADRLFRGDPRWVGADGAYSIALGDGRTLWLFGDTWVDPSGQGTRQGARMIRNSVAIQTGNDPAQATMAFHWRTTDEGRPGSFFEQEGDEWFWPGHGVRLGDRLVLFLSRLRGTRTGLGFESVGWNSVMVGNPDDEPALWNMRFLSTPPNVLGVQVGFASVLKWGGYVYAFGSQDPVKSHPIYAVRWPEEKVRRGDLQAPEWWAGPDTGWVEDSSSAPRWPVFENGQSELTVHYDDVARRFLAVQTVGFGQADVAVRVAPAVTGPWSAPRMIYRPPEYDRPNIMIYSAKAHPQFAGADLVLTYSTNTFDFADQLADSRIYYPRFVRLTWCE